MYHEMTVFGFTLDSIAHRPVVILKDVNDCNTVPIWISAMEAVSIAAELISRDISSQNGRRDLFSLLLEQTGMKVARVAIESLNDGVFKASVGLVLNGEEIKVDVRPCEAMITALKYKLPVMVAEDVVARASLHALSDERLAQENDERRFADLLESLDPADLGKYPM
jgi:bifunctional DNase/RNase